MHELEFLKAEGYRDADGLFSAAPKTPGSLAVLGSPILVLRWTIRASFRLVESKSGFDGGSGTANRAPAGWD